MAAAVDMSPSKSFMERFKKGNQKNKKHGLFAKKDSSSKSSKKMKVFGKMAKSDDDNDGD